MDWRLCFVADSEAAADMDVLALVGRAAAGGATLVQLRGKAWTDRQFLDLAGQAGEILRPAGIPLIINDRADIARAAGAAGVHLGRADLPVAAARRILGRRSIIGVSAGSPAEARRARRPARIILAWARSFRPGPRRTRALPSVFQGFER